MIRYGIISLAVAVMVCGCQATGPHSYEPTLMAAREYQDRPTLTTSLFKSDQAVLDDEAIKLILSSKLQLPAEARVALMKFPGSEYGALRYYGSYYWRSEDYLKTQQEYIDTLSKKLTGSDRIAELILLPSLLTPEDASIPVLREAAVRLQADLLLVFRLSSDIYHRPKFFAGDEVKAYSTCEAVLLDVRTGLIPFTTVTTRDVIEQKRKQDLEINETMRRAENIAVLDSLNAVADKLAAFLASVP